jgi:hypothetical protein
VTTQADRSDFQDFSPGPSDGAPRPVLCNAMVGIGREFAELYAQYLEPPAAFFYFTFLTYFGALVAKKITLASELRPEPRLYVVLLGESATTRKSTALHKVDEFFRSLDKTAQVPVLADRLSYGHAVRGDSDFDVGPGRLRQESTRPAGSRHEDRPTSGSPHDPDAPATSRGAAPSGWGDPDSGPGLSEEREEDHAYLPRGAAPLQGPAHPELHFPRAPSLCCDESGGHWGGHRNDHENRRAFLGRDVPAVSQNQGHQLDAAMRRLDTALNTVITPPSEAVV